LELLKQRPDRPLDSVTATAGLSLGEYTALVFAGAIDFEDAVKLVDIRGRAMQACADAHPGGMLAVLGLTRVPQRASVMSSTRRTEIPARYISIKASSTELSRRR
jgi:[acyl-carrier-protein] S-malonyltransferase